MKVRTNSSEILTIILIVVAIVVFLEKDRVRRWIGKEPPLPAAEQNSPPAPPPPRTTQFPEPDARLERSEKSGDCGSTSEAKTIEIREAQFRALVKSNGAQPLLFPRSPGCLIVGHKYDVIVNRTDNKDDVNYYREQRGQMQVIKLESIKPDVAAKMPANLNLTPAQKLKKPVTAVYGHWEREKGPETFGVPFYHPDSKTVTADQAKQLAAKGAVLCDVRPREQFKAGTIPGAISLEMSNYATVVDFIASPTFMKKRKIALDLASLNAAKTDNVVVFSNNPGDYGSYNAATLLAEAGYKNIYWLRGGLDETNGIGAAPENIPDVRLVKTSDAMVLQRAGAIFLDVRSAQEFNRLHLNGALNIPLVQKTDARGYAVLKRNDMTIAMMKAEGESIATEQNSLNMKAVYIVYGKSEYDWRPYKALLLLKDKGFKKVYWLRTGIVSWMRESYFNPGKMGFVRNNGQKKKNTKGAKDGGG